MKISPKWGILIIAIMLVTVPLLTACGDDETGEPTETETTPTETGTTTPPTTTPATPPTTTPPLPPVDGPTFIYEVTYDDPGGAEVTTWTLEVNAEETVEGVDCWIAEGTFDVNPFRLANPTGSPTTVEGVKYWISKATEDVIVAESKITGLADITSVQTYTYTGDHGQPFTFGDTYSADRATALTPPLMEVPTTPLAIEVTAVEEVELSEMGTMVCYKVEYTMQDMPLFVEWYSAEYDLVMPVKIENYSTYQATETKEMTSYDPMPEKNANIPPLSGGTEQTDTPPPMECNDLYWFDDTTTECGQKEFCGAYMYLGLQTFETLAECEAALPTTPGTTEPTSTPTPDSGGAPAVGTSWVYDVNYDCDEVGVSGNQITLANDTTWTLTVTALEEVDGVECFVTESTIAGEAVRRYPYPGGVTPAMDVPVVLAPTGVGPTVSRSIENGEIAKELFPLEANAMGGITLDVARNYVYDGRPADLSEGDSWTYSSQVDLDNFMFHESMTWAAEVIAVESIEVPLGTYDCYKVEAAGTGGENPDKTNYYWWDVNGEFPCPVKYQYNYIFMGAETKELSSYTTAS